MGKTKRRWKDGKEHQDRESRNRKAARSCLNHGGCSWCENNKLHTNKRRTPIILPEDFEVDTIIQKPNIIESWIITFWMRSS